MTHRTPRIPLATPCSHYRYEGTHHGCALLAQCEPIADGGEAAMHVCPSYLRNGNAMVSLPPMPMPMPSVSIDCKHLGTDTGQLTPCAEGCQGVRLKTFSCSIHGTCTVQKRGVGVPGCCRDCPDKTPKSTSPCDCPQPGSCPRYGREMHGREYEICRGVNVDAGEAANIRAGWRLRAGPVPAVMSATREPRRLILKNGLSPGDVLAMTAAVYSLHRQNPGRFITAIDSVAGELLQNNPDVVPIESLRGGDAEVITCHYPAIHHANTRGIHFMQGYCEFFAEVLGVPVPLLTNRPVLHLTLQEREPLAPTHPMAGGRHWLVNAGTKSDFTCKRWGRERYQAVVNALRGRVPFAQVGATRDDHRRLDGVVDLVGRTSLRELVRMCHHAAGIVTPPSLLMHVAAALDKPCVVVAGGREPVQWNAYPKMHYMHTIGAFSCCKAGACWRSRVERLNDGQGHDNSLCEQPITGEETIPRCMAAIRPEEVVEKILLHAS